MRWLLLYRYGGKLMKHQLLVKRLLFATLAVVILSVVFGLVSLYPPNQTINTKANGVSQNDDNMINVTFVNTTFMLSPGETYKQGLSSFRSGENISLVVQSTLPLNFSIICANATNWMVHSDTNYTISGVKAVDYTFNASANYYEAVFLATSDSHISFTATAQEPQNQLPYTTLNQASKVMFIASLSLAMLLLLVLAVTRPLKLKENSHKIASLSKRNRRLLIGLLLVSLAIWLYVVAVNNNPLGAFENWYTDNARDSYVATLFLKVNIKVFTEPLGTLASSDNSTYKFVSWPQMPHLYPIGSLLLFLPFGALIQQGFNQTLIFKTEIAVFLFFATACLYVFLKNYLKKDFSFRVPTQNNSSNPRWLKWLKSDPKLNFSYGLLMRIAGIIIMYYFIVVFAADGMFDAVALLFSLLALSMFVLERYDYFFALVMFSAFLKYQAAIFLLPLIAFGVIMLLKSNSLKGLLKNKAFLAGLSLGAVSLFTAYLSAPYLISGGHELITNNLNAFASNYTLSSISLNSWGLQTILVLTTLTATVAYAAYMLNKNSLLSLSALFILIPVFMLPYFQNWYLPFIFCYVLVAEGKREFEATILWAIFMVAMIFFSGVIQMPLWL
jgi:hypothetical protein